MTAPDPRPEAVEACAAWLRAYAADFTPEALRDRLLGQGYSEAEITAAMALAAQPDDAPKPRDLRAIGAGIVIVLFLVIWLVPSWPLLTSSSTGSGGVLSGILGFLMGLVALPTLYVISGSSGLKRGAVGTLIAILALPFTIVVILAGLCAASTGSLLGI